MTDSFTAGNLEEQNRLKSWQGPYAQLSAINLADRQFDIIYATAPNLSLSDAAQLEIFFACLMPNLSEIKSLYCKKLQTQESRCVKRCRAKNNANPILSWHLIPFIAKS